MNDCTNCVPCVDVYSNNLCPESLKGKCLFYTGEALTDLGINNTMNADQIIGIIVTAIKTLSDRIDLLEA